MKITFIYPAISEFVKFGSFGSDNYAANWIHHGLCSLSAYAKDKGFFDIDLIDLRKCLDWDGFKKQLTIKKPDIVGITMTSLDYNPAMKCIRIIKKCLPNALIAVGGIHPTVATEDILHNSNIDYIIIGEGEIAFVELLKKIENHNNSLKVIKGSSPNLESLPFDDRELFDYQESIKHPFRCLDIFSPPFVTIIVGRGCMYNCSFCQPSERIMFGNKVRMKSPERAIEELILLRQRYNFKSLMIHDDCLTEDREWTLKFCDLYESNGFKQPFFAQSRVDIICKNEDMIKRMAQVGLRYFSIGFESGNQRILNFLRKGTTVEQNYEAAKICKKYDIRIGGNFMLGIPTETRQEARDTIKLIKDIKPYSIGIACYTPYPGSYLYQYCLENNLSLIKDHRSYNRGLWDKKVKGVDYRYLKKIKNEIYGLSSIRVFLEEPFIMKILSYPLTVKFIKQLRKISIFQKLKRILLRI